MVVYNSYTDFMRAGLEALYIGSWVYFIRREWCAAVAAATRGCAHLCVCVCLVLAAP